MLTLKHIHMDGSEDIIPTADARFTPGTPNTLGVVEGGQSATPPTVWANSQPYTGGTIFIMNAGGKTVARYDLGASPVPIVGDGMTDPRPRGLAVVQ